MVLDICEEIATTMSCYIIHKSTNIHIHIRMKHIDIETLHMNLSNAGSITDIINGRL